MDIFLRRRDIYRQMYNCSFYSVDAVPLEKRQHPAYGAFLITLFFLIELLYIPCLYAMLQKELRKLFCYRMMSLMAIFDMLLVITTAFLPGISSLYGYVYCSFPVFVYIVGSILACLWIGYATSAMILAFNRCFQYTKYYFIFEGKRKEQFWLFLPVFATIFMLFFDHTATYSPVIGAFFYNVHVDYFPDPNNEYPSIAHLLFNATFSFLIPGVYIYYLKNSFRLSQSRSHGFTSHEYSLFFQLLGLNLTLASGVIVIAAMQIMPLPNYMMVYTHIIWIFISGAPPFVYLTFNKSIQRVLVKKIWSNQVDVFTSFASQTSQKNQKADQSDLTNTNNTHSQQQ